MTSILKTDRLHLRCFEEEDVSALYPILSDAEVMRYSMTGAMDLQQVEKYVQSCVKSHRENGYAPYALIHNGALIGYAGLDKRIVEGAQEIQMTFRLGQPYWGKGMATEIGRAVLCYAFDNLKLKEIIAIVDPDNQASIRLIEKLEMRLDKAVSYEGLALHVYRIAA